MSKVVAIVFIIIAFLSSHSYAAGDKGAQFGLTGGLSAVDAPNTKPFNFTGIKGSVFLAKSFTIGGYYLGSDSSGEGSSTETFRYSIIGLEASYRIGDNAGEGFAAFRAGLTKVTNNTPAQETIIYSPYHYGAAAGYDYNLNGWSMVGFEGSFLKVFNGRTSLGGVTYERDGFNIISFLISLQFKI